MMTEDKRSPLHDWHVEHGADVIWEDGYPWAMHEGGGSARRVRGGADRHRHLGPLLHVQVRGDGARRRAG